MTPLPPTALFNVMLAARPATLKEIGGRFAAKPTTDESLEDRRGDRRVLPMSVAPNASLASLDRPLRGGMVDPAREAAHV